MQHHDHSGSAGPAPHVGQEKGLCGTALECASNKPLPLQDLGMKQRSFLFFLECLEPILSPSQVRSTSIYEADSMEQSLILALTLRQPVCLLPTPWHSFQCALLSFSVQGETLSSFYFSTDISSWKKTGYPSTSVEQDLELKVSTTLPGQHSDKPSPSQRGDEYPSWHILGWGGMG